LLGKLKEAYFNCTGKNLPIYGVDAISLEQFETTKQHVIDGESCVPLENRILEEDTMKE
jgi:hypothetical protein